MKINMLIFFNFELRFVLIFKGDDHHYYTLYY